MAAATDTVGITQARLTASDRLGSTGRLGDIPATAKGRLLEPGHGDVLQTEGRGNRSLRQSFIEAKVKVVV